MSYLFVCFLVCVFPCCLVSFVYVLACFVVVVVVVVVVCKLIYLAVDNLSVSLLLNKGLWKAYHLQHSLCNILQIRQLSRTKNIFNVLYG